MTDPLPALMQSAMRDALTHRAYLHAIQADAPTPTGEPLRPVTEETARAMVVAYIGAQRPAHVAIELPPEQKEDWRV